MRRGAEEFDFLCGQEPYKYLWGAQDRPTARLRLIAMRPAIGERSPQSQEIHRAPSMRIGSPAADYGEMDSEPSAAARAEQH
jgi:hypothetical protein